MTSGLQLNSLLFGQLKSHGVYLRNNCELKTRHDLGHKILISLTLGQLQTFLNYNDDIMAASKDIAANLIKADSILVLTSPALDFIQQAKPVLKLICLNPEVPPHFSIVCYLFYLGHRAFLFSILGYLDPEI